MSNDSKKSNEHTPKENQKGSIPNSGYDQPVLPPSAAITETNQPPAASKTCPCCAKSKDWKDHTKFYVEIVGAILAGSVVIIMICQYRELRKTRMQDERAWVTPIRYAIESSKYRVEFQNTGKTPAINVDSDVRSTANMNEVPDARWPFNPPGPYSGILGPNVHGHADTERISGSYFYGRIWYDDIFGNHHWTDFCVITNSSAVDDFVAMPFGNTTDDSKPDKPH